MARVKKDALCLDAPGISGWTYPPWRGVFFPKGLPHRRELEYASRKLSSIEINGTFYSLQRVESWERWRDETPDGFVFSVKGPRFITHIRRLRDSKVPLANFFASGVLALGPKLGPVLWQLPPNFMYGRERLEDFLKLLPHTTAEAAVLAKRHDFRLAGRSWMRPEEDLPLRHALEVRHASFGVPEFFEQLRAHKVALVTADTAGKWPFFEEQTADFAYARLHGDEELYTSGYTPAALRVWAGRVRAWTRDERDAFVYFDNDRKVRAPFDAMSLSSLLGQRRHLLSSTGDRTPAGDLRVDRAQPRLLAPGPHRRLAPGRRPRLSHDRAAAARRRARPA